MASYLAAPPPKNCEATISYTAEEPDSELVTCSARLTRNTMTGIRLARSDVVTRATSANQAMNGSGNQRVENGESTHRPVIADVRRHT